MTVGVISPFEVGGAAQTRWGVFCFPFLRNRNLTTRNENLARVRPQKGSQTWPLAWPCFTALGSNYSIFLLKVSHPARSSSGLLNRFLDVFMMRVSETFSVFRRADLWDFLVPQVNPDYLERLQHTLSIGRRVRKETRFPTETQELRGENLRWGYRGPQLHLCSHGPEEDTLAPSFH